MINPKELRLGNIVTASNARGVVISIKPNEIGIQYFDAASSTKFISPQNVRPIPVDEVMLQKLGFTRSQERPQETQEYMFEVFDEERSIIYAAKAQNGEDYAFALNVKGWWANKNQHYLHQLQNLYYSIREEEFPLPS